MALGATDERDLLIPLYSGLGGVGPWSVFLDRLRIRTGAKQVRLYVRRAEMPDRIPALLAVSGDSTALDFDLVAFKEAGLLPYDMIRTQRVYSFEEFSVPRKGGRSQDSLATFAKEPAVYGRFMRLLSDSGHEAWTVLLHDRVDFSAADSALLNSLASHLSLMLDLLVMLDGLHLRLAIAQEALGSAGVGQVVLDRVGHLIEADDTGARILQIPPGASASHKQGRTRWSSRALAEACRKRDDEGVGHNHPATNPIVVHMDGGAECDVLLRPAPDYTALIPSPGRMVGLVRKERVKGGPEAARILSKTLGISLREAALALALARGLSIVEAGAELHLTPETARNYTKRIYAKTGAKGQADLVRMVLGGLAPFA